VTTTLPKLFRTTTFKMALSFALLYAGVAALAAVYVHWNASRLLDDRLTQTLQAETRGLAEQYRSGGLRRLMQVIRQRVRSPDNSIYLLTDHQGGRLAGNVKTLSRKLWNREGRVEFAYGRKGAKGVETRHAVAHVYRLAAGFRLMVGRDVENQRQFSVMIRNGLLTGLAFLMLTGLGGGWLVSRNLLQRIDAVTQTSRVIMAGDMSGRVPIKGTGDELDRLAISLNAMLERIEQLMTGLQEVSDNIAHDLKTPLNRLRNRVETVLREGNADDYHGALEATIEESDELIRTFNALLSIARLEAGGGTASFALHDVRQVLSYVVELYDPLAEEEHIELSLHSGAPVSAMLDRQLVGQAVSNLVDNAIKYGRPDEARKAGGAGAKIELLVFMGDDGDREDKNVGRTIHIDVRDNGEGVAPEERAEAIKRFGRLEKSRSRPGTGLGLSLVAAVAKLHGGSLQLLDNQPGLICRFSIKDTHSCSGSDLSA